MFDPCEAIRAVTPLRIGIEIPFARTSRSLVNALDVAAQPQAVHFPDPATPESDPTSAQKWQVFKHHYQ
jgi:hypothetical protein